MPRAVDFSDLMDDTGGVDFSDLMTVKPSRAPKAIRRTAPAPKRDQDVMDRYSPVDPAKVKALAKRPATPSALQMREFATGKKERRSSAVGAAGAYGARAVVPTAASIGAGALTGAGMGMVAGPVGAVVGGLGGALVGGGVAAYGQEELLKRVPQRLKEKYGQADWQLEEAAREHPYASFAGSVAPGVLTGNVPVRAGAAALSGGIGGGLEAAREFLTEGKLDPGKIGIATGAGIAGTRPNRFSRGLYGNPDTAFKTVLRRKPPPAPAANAEAAALRAAGVRPKPIEVLGDNTAVLTSRQAAGKSSVAADLMRKYSTETRDALPADAAPLVESAVPEGAGLTPVGTREALAAKYAGIDAKAKVDAKITTRQAYTKARTLDARKGPALAAVDETLEDSYRPPLERDVVGERVQNAAAKWSEHKRIEGGELLEKAQNAVPEVHIPPPQALKYIDEQLALAEVNPIANSAKIKMLAGWKGDLKQEGMRNLQATRDLVSSIYATKAPEGLQAGEVARLRGDFRHALKTDIENGLMDASATNPKAGDALTDFRAGNAVWTERKTTLDSALLKILGKKITEDTSDPENMVYVAEQTPEAATVAIRKLAADDHRGFQTVMRTLDPDAQKIARDAVVTSLGRDGKGAIDPAKFIAEANALPQRTRDLLFEGEPIEMAAQRAIASREATKISYDQRQAQAENTGATREAAALRVAEAEKTAEGIVETGLKTGDEFATTSPTDFADLISRVRLDPKAFVAAKVAARQYMRDNLKSPDAAYKFLEKTLGENQYAQTNLAALLGAKEAGTLIQQAQTLARRSKLAKALDPGAIPHEPEEHGTTAMEEATVRTSLISSGHGAFAFGAGKLWTFLRGHGMSEKQAEQVAIDALDPAKTDDILAFVTKLYGQSSGKAFAGRVRATGARYGDLIHSATGKVTALGAGWDTKAGRREGLPGGEIVESETTDDVEPTSGPPGTPRDSSAEMVDPIDPNSFKSRPIEELKPAVAYTESRNNPAAISPKGAEGTMQVMPATQRNPGYGVKPVSDNSAAEKTRSGEDYLNAMINEYKGNQALALMAYNWGPGNVDNWLAGGMKGKIPKETADYVKAILGS